MKSTKKITLLLLMACVLAFSGILTACGTASEEPQLDESDIDYALNEGEMDNIKVDPSKASEAQKLNQEEENFYGTWVATSPEAQNLYGHLEITINENGTFDADITDEQFTGTWKKIDGGISYTTEAISGKFYYGPTCQMIIQENGETAEDDIRVTLEKQE